MMNKLKQFWTFFRRWALISGTLFLWLPAGQAGAYALGDIPLDQATYDSRIKSWPDRDTATLSSSYDARNDGIVSSPKDQGACGACWAFASAGAMESHILKKGGSATDLAEQQLISCNGSGYNCCGGSMDAMQFWETKGPVLESCNPYGESGNSSCPATKPCTTCSQRNERVTGWYTVQNTPDQMKASLYNDGPSYWRFDVYSDFYTFWNSAAAGTVYLNSPGTTYEGGHAVLLIGWDDSKGAYLCKNSWGATGGPQRDGTFWIAYTGHAHDLRFGMSNFQITGGSTSDFMQDFHDAAVYQGLANYYAKIGAISKAASSWYSAYTKQKAAAEKLYSAYLNAPTGNAKTYAYSAYNYAISAQQADYNVYLYGGAYYTSLAAASAFYSQYYAAAARYFAALSLP
jgi:hypothetical protein